MALTSEKLNQWIEIQSQSITSDSSGGQTRGSWSYLLGTWSQFVGVSASGGFSLGQYSKETSVVFRVRFDSRITGENQRVVFKGSNYLILNVLDEDGLESEMTIIAEKE